MIRFILASVCAVSLVAEDRQPPLLTVDEAVVIAREQSERVLAASARQQASVHEGRAITAELYPSIRGSAGYSTQGDRDVYFNGQRTNVDAYDTWSAGLRVDQFIYGFGKRSALQSDSQGLQDSASAQFDGTKRDVELLTRNAVIDWTLAQAGVRISKRRQIRRTEELKLVKVLKDAGLSDALEVGQAELEVINTNNEVTATESNVRNKHIAVAEILSLEPQQFRLQAPQLPPPDLEAWLHQAEAHLTKSPEIRNLQAEHKRLQAAHAARSADNLPQVGLFASLDSASEEFDDPAEGWTAGVSVSWNIYAGGRNRSTMSALQLQSKQLELQTKVVLRERLRQYLTLKNDAESLNTRIVTQKRSLTIADDNYQAALDQFEKGLINRTRLEDFNLAISEAEYRLATLLAEIGIVYNRIRSLAQQ